MREKKCTGPCGCELPATTEHFHRNKHSSDGLAYWCKTCMSKYHHDHNKIESVKSRARIAARNHRNNHPELRDEGNRKQKRYYANLKRRVIDHYGGKCACPGCGENRIEFLTIDHVNNDGARHRREIGEKNARHVYLWLIRNNFPTGFQVLCFNCNCAKRVTGICPHVKYTDPEYAI